MKEIPMSEEDDTKKVDIRIDYSEQYKAQVKTKAFNVLVATSDSFMPARNQHGKYLLTSEEGAVRFINTFNKAVGVPLGCTHEEHGVQLHCIDLDEVTNFLPTIRFDIYHKLIETQQLKVTPAGIEIRETQPSVVLLKDAQVGDLVECISAWTGPYPKFAKGKTYRLVPRAHDGQNLHEFAVMDMNGSPYPLQLNQRSFIKVFEANAFKTSGTKEQRDDSVLGTDKSVNMLDMSDKIEMRYRRVVGNGVEQITVYVWYHKTKGLMVVPVEANMPVLNKGVVSAYGVPIVDEVLAKAVKFMSDNYTLSRLEQVKRNGTVLKFSAFK